MNTNNVKAIHSNHSGDQSQKSTSVSNEQQSNFKKIDVKNMNTLKPIAFSNLFHELKQCTEIKYHGQLKVISSEGEGITWIFYYRFGQLVWATGGSHTSRRLRRNINQYCPKIDINKIQVLSAMTTLDYWDDQIEDIIFLNAEDVNVEYWDYRILQTLYKSQKIDINQINSIAENTISELLFDIAQQINYSSLRCQRNQDVILDAPLTSTSANIFFQQMEEFWQNWVQAGLAIYSPNLAPVLQKPEKLKKQVSPATYKNVEALINGKYSLWDLSVKTKQSILSITSWLLPLNRQGITEFVEVSDLQLPLIKSQNKCSPIPEVKKLNTPLIACVDDNSMVCEIMEEVVISNGMRFLKLEASVETLPLLIQNKPDFIFLDIIMPIMNSYELCHHLPKNNVLANTPVVMLTANDSVFDKVRSKLFGATDCISKPIDENAVINIIHQYLSSTSTILSGTITG
ncbi:MAG: response regulator [Cuspidothrix sp.]